MAHGRSRGAPLGAKCTPELEEGRFVKAHLETPVGHFSVLTSGQQEGWHLALVQARFLVPRILTSAVSASSRWKPCSRPIPTRVLVRYSPSTFPGPGIVLLTAAFEPDRPQCPRSDPQVMGLRPG